MIQKIMLATALLTFVGCSSAQKNSSSTSSSTEKQAAAPAQKEALKKAEKPTQASQSKSTETMPSAEGVLSCTSGCDKRTLEIKTTENKGCELHYTKMEGTQTVATQIEGNEKCVEVQERIKSKLEAAGFSCL